MPRRTNKSWMEQLDAATARAYDLGKKDGTAEEKARAKNTIFEQEGRTRRAVLENLSEVTKNLAEMTHAICRTIGGGGW